MNGLYCVSITIYHAIMKEQESKNVPCRETKPQPTLKKCEKRLRCRSYTGLKPEKDLHHRPAKWWKPQQQTLEGYHRVAIGTSLEGQKMRTHTCCMIHPKVSETGNQTPEAPKVPPTTTTAQEQDTSPTSDHRPSPAEHTTNHWTTLKNLIEPEKDRYHRPAQ